MSIMAGDYQHRLKSEQARFRDISNVHDLPPIFHYWSEKYIRPPAEEFGFAAAEDFFAKYLSLTMEALGEEEPAFLSLGAGNCDAEVRVARLLRDAGHSRFVIECLDLNPAMLQRGRNLARETGLTDHLAFVEGDFNHWKSNKQYAAIIANQALHHVVELEALFAEVKKALLPGGYFVTSDMIGRNGHLRWPEALEPLQRFWRELPVEYRWNGPLERYEETYVNHDCSSEGFEGVRAQDVLPLLLEHFDFHLFLAFGGVVDVFVDRNFGHNFDPSREWDRDFIDHVQAFNEEALLAGLLTPTQMYAVMTVEPCTERRYSRGLIPAQCVRKADVPPSPRLASAVSPRGERLSFATSSLRPITEGGVRYRQLLEAGGGEPPYSWSGQELPVGIQVHSSGLVRGKIRYPGVFTPVITVTDSSFPGQTAKQRFTIIIEEGRIDLGPVIRSPSRLPNGIAGAPHNQPLIAASGRPPYTWSIVAGNVPAGLELGSGGTVLGSPLATGRTVFTVQVTDASGNSELSDLTLAIDPEPGTRRLILPQVASGGGWRTHLRLINASPSQAEITVSLRAGDGAALSIPLSVQGAGESKEKVTSELVETVAPYSSLRIKTVGPSGPGCTGWGEIAYRGRLTGYGVLEHSSGRTLRTELLSELRSSFVLPYDNTDGCGVGVGLVNTGHEAASLAATIWDDDWTVLSHEALSLPARGHASFALSEKFPVTANRHGVLKFHVSEPTIAGMALRFEPDGRFVTLPNLPDV